MTTTSLSRRIPDASGRVRAALLVGVACAVGLVAGRLAISHYGTTAVEALVAVPILIYVSPRPMVSLILLLALTSSVFAYDVLPRLSLPGHLPLNVGDVILLATAGGTIWRRPWRTWPAPVKRFFVVVGVMLLLALIPTIRLAMGGHNAAREAIQGYKTLLYLTGALTIAVELSGRQWRTLLGALIVVSTLVSVLSVAAAASGGFASLLAGWDPNSTLSAAVVPGASATARVRLPGLFLVYAMTIPTLVMVLTVKDRWRTARIVALVLMIAAIAISLNRNMYFGGLIALLITILVGGPRLRHRFLATAVAVIAVLAIFIQSAVVPAATNVTARATSALSTKVLTSGSAQARADEFSHAFTAISQNPWYGVGWFQNYGSYTGGDYRLGVEDWYLHVTTDLGIPVAVAFMLIPWMVLAYGLRSARAAARPRERALAAAGVGSVIALLLSCLVGAYLQDPGSMLVFGVSCAFVLAAGMQASAQSEPELAAGGEALVLSSS